MADATPRSGIRRPRENDDDAAAAAGDDDDNDDNRSERTAKTPAEEGAPPQRLMSRRGSISNRSVGKTFALRVNNNHIASWMGLVSTVAALFSSVSDLVSLDLSFNKLATVDVEVGERRM